jgi:hypothetical protein
MYFPLQPLNRSTSTFLKKITGAPTFCSRVFSAFVYLKRLAGPVTEKKIKNRNEQAYILLMATYIGHSKKTTQWYITPRKTSNRIRISCHYVYLHDMALHYMFLANTYYVLNNYQGS